jgi:hypothetical protein
MGRSTRTTAPVKQTHKLTPQTCVVWVPDAPGYAANFGPGIFQVASHPEFAYHLTEDQAEVLAIALRLQLGLRSTIRPYYQQRKSGSGAAFVASPMVITGITSGARKND